MTVKQIQCLLTYLGYSPGAIDGIDGRNTQGAIRVFQADYGLTVNGIPGAATQKMLIGAIAGTAVKVEKPESSDEPKTGTFWDDIRYFTREEFRCKCGGKYCNGFPAEPQEGMVRALDAVRAHFGKAIIPNSGVRCPTHNANVRGVSNSRHLSGKAVDFAVPGKTASQVLEYLATLPGLGYCYDIDGTSVHMDIE